MGRCDPLCHQNKITEECTLYDITQGKNQQIYKEKCSVNVQLTQHGLLMKKANSKYNSEWLPKPRQNLIIWLVKSACDDKIHKQRSLKFGAGLPENVTSQRTARQTTSDHSSITACPLVLAHHSKQSKAVCFTQTSWTVILQLHSCYHLGYGCTLSIARCHHIHL